MALLTPEISLANGRDRLERTGTGEYFVPLDALMPLFREQWDKGASVRFSPRGTSMLPMLRQGVDTVTLSPLPAELKKYDLPLYRTAEGKYVLHRIVRVEGERYTCMGDNLFVPEPGLGREQMLALVTAFTRGTKEHRVTEPGYRLYCCLWHRSRPLRRFWRRGIRWLRRHWK